MSWKKLKIQNNLLLPIDALLYFVYFQIVKIAVLKGGFMKKLIQVVTVLAFFFLLLSCGPTKPDQSANLKAENDNLLLQIDALNEKIMSLSAEVSNYKELKLSNAMTYTNLVKDLQEQLASNETTVKELENSVKVTFVGDVFFDEGSDVIKPAGKKSLDKIVKSLTMIKDRLIRIEGYTDDVPIAPKHQTKFPSNWELSTARADAVVRYLVEKGVVPEMIKSAGYGKYNPVASNATSEGKAKNRRIEVELVQMDTRAKFK